MWICTDANKDSYKWARWSLIMSPHEVHVTQDPFQEALRRIGPSEPVLPASVVYQVLNVLSEWDSASQEQLDRLDGAFYQTYLDSSDQMEEYLSESMWFPIYYGSLINVIERIEKYLRRRDIPPGHDSFNAAWFMVISMLCEPYARRPYLTAGYSESTLAKQLVLCRHPWVTVMGE